MAARKRGRGWFSNQQIYHDVQFDPLPLPAHDCPLPSASCQYPTGDHTDHEGKEDRAFCARVEKLAKDYLEGRTLWIQSAQLRGPFDDTWPNPWVLQNKQDRVARHRADTMRISELVRNERRQQRRQERANRAARLQSDGFGKSLLLPVDLTDDQENSPDSVRYAKRGANFDPRVDPSQRILRERRVDFTLSPHAVLKAKSIHVTANGPNVKPYSALNSLLEPMSPDNDSPSPAERLARMTTVIPSTLREERSPASLTPGKAFDDRSTLEMKFSLGPREVLAQLCAHGLQHSKYGSASESLPITSVAERDTQMTALPFVTKPQPVENSEEASPVSPIAFSETNGAEERQVISVHRRQCTECGTTSSARWLKGPTGPATLCVRCGGRYYRQGKKTERLVPLALQEASDQSKQTGRVAPLCAIPQRPKRTPRNAMANTPASLSHLRISSSKTPAQYHRSVVKTMFPDGMSRVLLSVCPTADLLGGFVTSPLLKRSSIEEPNEPSVEVPEAIMKPANKRKKFMTFETPPLKPAPRRIDIREGNRVDDDDLEIAAAEEIRNVLTSSENETLRNGSAGDATSGPPPSNALALEITVARMNVSKNDEAQAESIFDTLEELANAPPPSVPIRTEIMGDDDNVLEQEQGLTEPTEKVSRTGCDNRLLDGYKAPRPVFASVGSKGSAAINTARHEDDVGDIDNMRTTGTPINGTGVGMDDELETEQTSDVSEADDDERPPMTAAFMSTQAAMLQANEAFYDGLDTPNKSIIASTHSQPVHEDCAATPMVKLPLAQKSFVNITLDSAQEQPMNTQDLFDNAPGFDFSTGRKPRSLRKRISFAPSPLVHRNTGAHFGTDDGFVEDIDRGRFDSVLATPKSNRSGALESLVSVIGWKEHSSQSYSASFTTLSQDAQVQASEDNTDINELIDDTLSFLGSCAGEGLTA